MFEMLESKRVSNPGIALHVGLVVLGAILSGQIRNPWPLIAAVLIGSYFLFSDSTHSIIVRLIIVIWGETDGVGVVIGEDGRWLRLT